jgi:hypothetical protein
LVRIGFVITGYNGKSKYYNGNVKPFVDLSCGLSELSEKAILFIHESEKQLSDKIMSLTRGSVPIVFFNDDTLKQSIQKFSPDFVIVEDNLEYMQKILSLKIPSVRLGVFVQYLYGVNTNKGNMRNRSLKLNIGSILPWRLVIKKYRDLLCQFDFIIANSQTCGYILRQFYDLAISGTVYPPVGNDMRVFLKDNKDHYVKKGILIFVGNIENDYYERDLLKEISDMRKELKEPIMIFSSNAYTAEYFTKQGFTTYSNLTVEELVKLFQTSRITYVPTSYELFGHVGAESILFGTPVILDTYHPFLEEVPMETKAVIIANPNSTISDVVKEMIKEDIDMETARNAVLNHYSVETSARSLIKALHLNHNKNSK